MKPLLLIVATCLPLLAQQNAPTPQDSPPPPPLQGETAALHGNPHRAAFMEKFDTNKDGRIDEQEKEAMRAAIEAKRAEFQKKILEKYDANKDGQLDEQEKAAAKADFHKNGPHRPHMMRHHGHGPAMPPPDCRRPAPSCGGPQAGPECPPPSCGCCCARRHGHRPPQGPGPECGRDSAPAAPPVDAPAE